MVSLVKNSYQLNCKLETKTDIFVPYESPVEGILKYLRVNMTWRYVFLIIQN